MGCEDEWRVMHLLLDEINEENGISKRITFGFEFAQLHTQLCVICRQKSDCKEQQTTHTHTRMFCQWQTVSVGSPGKHVWIRPDGCTWQDSQFTRVTLLIYLC